MAVVERAEKKLMVLVGVPLLACHEGQSGLADARENPGAGGVDTKRGSRPCARETCRLLNEYAMGLSQRKEKNAYGISDGVSGLEGGCGRVVEG